MQTESNRKRESRPKPLPYLSIRYADYAISIGREVVRLLGTPKYVTLLMNWEERTMAVLACDEKTSTSFKVPEKFLTDRNCNFRIYSASFVKEIGARWNIGREGLNRYKGSYSESLHAVVFQL